MNLYLGMKGMRGTVAMCPANVHLNVNGRPRGQARPGEDAPCGGCVSVANCRARVVACELVAGM